MRNIIKTNKNNKILEKAEIPKDMPFKFRIKCSKRRTNRMKLSKKHVEGWRYFDDAGRPPAPKKQQGGLRKKKKETEKNIIKNKNGK